MRRKNMNSAAKSKALAAFDHCQQLSVSLRIGHTNAKRKSAQFRRHSSFPSICGTFDCVVCGARASGVHYMVWSCNGCKTFFRRAIMENRKYSCARNGKCLINVNNRCCCRHCRFEKCRKVGMVFTELNVEHKRRVNMAKALILDEKFGEWGQEDPLIRQLLAKQMQFRTLLTSSFTPIFTSIDHALQQPTVFDLPLKIFESFQMRIPGTQLDFYGWRARILSVIVEWIKSFSENIPAFDQQSLIVHCSFALLVFCEAFLTPERFSDRLVYPDGLQVTRNFSRGICIPQNGLISGIVAVINHILAPIRRIQLNEVEYVFLQMLLLFDTDCLSLSEKTVQIVNAKREMILDSLQKYLNTKMDGNALQSANRMAELLLRIPNIQKVAAFKRQFFLDENSLKFLGPNYAKSSFAIQLANLYPNISFF